MPKQIAYFSPEFGIAAVLPQYSGGLGILAGDHLKTASDLGVPILGVGLLYRHGYFRQSLSGEGWQQERYPVVDPDGLPITLLREATARRRTSSRAARRPLPAARIWVAQVGRVPLLLLDSDIEANSGIARRHGPAVRRGVDHRLLQEMLLGNRRGPCAARVLPHHGRTGSGGVPHQRGARRVPRPRADQGAHRGQCGRRGVGDRRQRDGEHRGRQPIARRASRRGWTSTPRWRCRARAPCSPRTHRSRRGSTDFPGT